MARSIEVAKFSLFATAVAIAYGIAHDLVTAHVAVEYFTVHHPRLVASTSPWVMAFLWGVLATFWVGAPAGLVIGFANLVGSRPSHEWAVLRRAFVKVTIALWLSAMAVLVSIYALAGLAPMDKRGETFESDRRLISVAITHQWSYAASVIACSTLSIWVYVSRKRIER